MVLTRSRSLDFNFHYFPRLPAELRLQIWELTLPEARIIVSHYRSLRPMYRRAAADENHEDKYVILGVIRAPPNLETPFPDITRYRVPTPLHVCRESRAQALQSYTPVLRLKGDSEFGSFYVDPRRDVLLIDSMRLRSRVVLDYGEQLAKFETLFVDDAEWNYVVPTQSANERRLNEYSRKEDIKKLLSGVKTVYHTRGQHDSSWCGCPHNCFTWEDPAIAIAKMTRPGLWLLVRKRQYDQWLLTGQTPHNRPKDR